MATPANCGETDASAATVAGPRMQPQPVPMQASATTTQVQLVSCTKTACMAADTARNMKPSASSGAVPKRSAARPACGDTSAITAVIGSSSQPIWLLPCPRTSPRYRGSKKKAAQ